MVRRAMALVAAAVLTAIAVPANAATVSQLSAPATPAIVPVEEFPAADNNPDTLPPPADEIASDAQALEWGFLLGAGAASDLMGYEPSLYTGKWYMPGKEDVRRCIMDRESNHNYRASNGTYHGAYQMSGPLGVGATWMMQRDVRKEFGDEGVKIVQELRKLTPNKWNRYWQDRAFWTVWRNGAGADHWRGDGCNRD